MRKKLQLLGYSPNLKLSDVSVQLYNSNEDDKNSDLTKHSCSVSYIFLKIKPLENLICLLD
jgi:hypothetical protein